MATTSDVRGIGIRFFRTHSRIDLSGRRKGKERCIDCTALEGHSEQRLMCQADRPSFDEFGNMQLDEAAAAAAASSSRTSMPVAAVNYDAFPGGDVTQRQSRTAVYSFDPSIPAGHGRGLGPSYDQVSWSPALSQRSRLASDDDALARSDPRHASTIVRLDERKAHKYRPLTSSLREDTATGTGDRVALLTLTCK